ncbi:MAG: hypothetical protein ACLUVC_05365 [Longibaculum sp.]
MRKHMIYGKKISVLILAVIMILTSLIGISNNHLFAYDDENQILNYDIQQSDDKKSATIHFKIEEVDEKYTIHSISSKGGKVIYDINDPKEAQMTVIENGNYQFTVEYTEKIEVEKKVEQPVEEPKKEETVETESPEKNIADPRSEEKVTNEGSSTEEGTNEGSTQEDTQKKVMQSDIKTVKTTKESQPKEIVESEIKKLTLSVDVKDIQTTEVEQNTEVTPTQDSKQKPSTNKKVSNRTALKAGNDSINLEDVFKITGNQTLNYQSIASVKGSAIKMSNENLRNNYQYQAIGMTSQTKISFNRSWVLRGSYSQAHAPDGVSFSFHNNANFDGSLNKGGALGVYRQVGATPSPTRGLNQGLVVELDPYANKGDDQDRAFRNFSDSDYDGADLDASHIDIHNVSDGVARRLSEKKSFNGRDVFNSSPSELEIKWDRPSKTISVSYKGHSNKYTFSDDDELLRTINSNDFECYYTIVSSLHYYDSSVYGDTYFTYDDFRYTDVNSQLIKTTQAIVDSSVPGGETAIDITQNNDLNLIKSGDVIVFRHELKNNSATAEISDAVSINLNLSITNKPLQIVPGSIKWYTQNHTNEKSISSDLFTPIGTNITYPAQSQECWIEYQVKIPDYIDLNQPIKLNNSQYLGELGMEQKIYMNNANVISRTTLVEGQNVVLENVTKPIDNEKTSLSNSELLNLFFGNMSGTYRAKDQMTYSNNSFIDIGTSIYNDLDTFADFIITSASQTDSATGEKYTYFTDHNNLNFAVKKFDGDDRNITSLKDYKPNELGMYCVEVKNFDEAFNNGHKNWNTNFNNANPNGISTLVRRIWVSDSFDSQMLSTKKINTIASNIEIDDLSLSKMSSEDIKKMFSDHIKVYIDTTSIDANSNIQGQACPIPYQFTVTDFLDFSSQSPAKDTPYVVRTMIETEDGSYFFDLNVKVRETEPQFYIYLPRAVELKDNEGIDRSYIGNKNDVFVSLKDGLEQTSKKIKVETDSSFQLIKDGSNDNYTVNLYDTSGQPLNVVENKINIGTLSSTQDRIQFWLNAKKAINEKGQYRGIMNYYISFEH